MSKPKTIIFNNGHTIPLKDICVMFKARYAWMDGVKYILPEEWNDQKHISNTNNN